MGRACSAACREFRGSPVATLTDNNCYFSLSGIPPGIFIFGLVWFLRAKRKMQQTQVNLQENDA